MRFTINTGNTASNGNLGNTSGQPTASSTKEGRGGGGSGRDSGKEGRAGGGGGGGGSRKEVEGRELSKDHDPNDPDSRDRLKTRKPRLKSATRNRGTLLEVHLPELTYKTDTMVIPKARFNGLVVEGSSPVRCLSPRGSGGDSRGGNSPGDMMLTGSRDGVCSLERQCLICVCVSVAVCVFVGVSVRVSRCVYVSLCLCDCVCL